MDIDWLRENSAICYGSPASWIRMATVMVESREHMKDC